MAPAIRSNKWLLSRSIYMLILLLLPGCHYNDSGNAHILAHKGYVNVSELLALHPSWRQAQILDQLITEMRQTDRTSLIPWTNEKKIHAPSPLAEVSPQEIQPPAMAGVLAPAFKRIEGLRTMLESQNQKAVDEERKADEQQLLADIAQKKSELANLQAQEEAQQNKLYLDKIRKQQILIIALQTQIRAYQGPLRADAQSRMIQANNIIDQLQKELQSKNLLIEAKYVKSLADFQTERQLALKNQLEELNDRLSALATKKIDKYKAEISVNLNSISSGSETQTIPSIKPFREQLSISTPIMHPGRLAHTTSFASETTEIHKLQDQRARLLDYITNDITRRLDYLSAESGWELTFQPHPGVPDVTAQFENILKNDIDANKMMPAEQMK